LAHRRYPSTEASLDEGEELAMVSGLKHYRLSCFGLRKVMN